jgi:hypothetical protein
MMTTTYSLLQAREGRMVPVVAGMGRAAREGAEKMLKPNKLILSATRVKHVTFADR